MPSEREFSAQQRKIINRYYEHRDTISVTKLSEIISDLALNADNPKKTDQLWTRAEKHLAHLSANDTRVARILSERDVTGLAQLVNELA